MLNIAAVPILNITLRNNLLDAIPIKKFLKEKNFCIFLLDDHKKSIKGRCVFVKAEELHPHASYDEPLRKKVRIDELLAFQQLLNLNIDKSI